MILRNRTRHRIVGMAGEAALIFIGITAAIWFENGNDNRRERAVEGEVMRNLVIDLQSDTTDLNSNLRSLRDFLEGTDTVIVALSSDRDWDPRWSSYFGYAYGVVFFMGSRAGYQHLSAEGLDILVDSDLRSRITKYYEFQSVGTARVEERFVLQVRENVLKPHMIEKFRFDLTVPRGSPFLVASASPVDFEALKDDNAFLNAIRDYQGGLSMQVQVSEQQVALAEGLLNDLRSALAVR